MGNLGITELIILVLSLTVGLVPIIGCVLGIMAFLKVRKIEAVLKENQIL